MYKRTLQDTIENFLFKGKAIVIYGPRQVGKTTLSKVFLAKTAESHYISCDDPFIVQTLENQTYEQLKKYYGKYKLLIIDEAQRVRNIGLTLKIFTDQLPEIQIIATGSSSFDLANHINEPLTGRTYTFHLYPLSLEEIAPYSDRGVLEQNLEMRMLHGMYPSIVTHQSVFDLRLLSESYLYKDILTHQNIKKSPLLFKLLQALALQIGSEVSFNELAQIVGAEVGTVIKYINLLEQSFVIFGLHALSRNARNELKKAKKYYFRDTGLRNGLIQNFNALNLRADIGALWENFYIVERIKYRNNHLEFPNIFFRRTTTQQEIDFIEEENGILHTYEIKRSQQKKVRIPSEFSKHYTDYTFNTINPQTFRSSIGL